MHMSLVGGGILWLVIRLLRPTSIVRAGFDTARLAAPCAIVAVLGYAAISGGGVAVARSVLMSLLALGALAVGLRSGAGTGLSLAALALGLAEPGVANDAGFQLSFAAVAALLSQRQSLTVLGRLRPRPIAWMVSAFWLSLVAAGATAPLTAQHFHRVSWISPVANLAAAIPIAGAVALGLAAAVLHLFVPQAAALGFEGAAWSAHVVLRVAASAARLPFAESAVIAPGWPLVVCFSAFAASSALPEAGRRRVRVAIAIVSFGLVTAMWHERFRTDRLDVVFVSVGQGDATVVRLPGGRVLVVDAGLPGRGRLAVAPYLRRLHVGRVDYLVASHVQDDHWGGLPEVAEEFEIGEFWHPGGACEIPRFMDFTRALTDRGIDVIDVGALHGRGGILRRTGPEGWRIEAVWPTDAEGGCSANDRSIVLSIRYAGRTLVLTGDIEAATEHTLARVGGVSADLLKVPHHGSATSSTPEFLAAVAPAVAVASVGGNNRYGFPRPEVEARYRDAGASFFRTDRDGAVVATVGATCMTVRAAKRR
jgi:competence protein ComEC